MTSIASVAPVVALLAAIGLAAPPLAHAQDGDTYEKRRMQALLDSLNLDEDAAAEGKRIAFIRIQRDDVFVEEEVFPTFFNIFHWLTREEIVRRELLFGIGDSYDDERVEETMRNLRQLGIFSTVRIVPVATNSVDEVGVVVQTRDLWSLRFEQGFQITGSQVDMLLLQLSERNLFGQQKLATVRFYMVPDTYQLGQVYLDRRILGERLQLRETGDLIFNRESNALEGGVATVSLQQPFYDLDQHYGFSLDLGYRTEIERRLQNGRVVAYDIPETAEEEAIASVWDEDRIETRLVGLYRRGRSYKQTFGLGLRYDEIAVAPNVETGLAAGQLEPFARDVLPRERRQLGPIVSYSLFTPSFVTFENLTTFGQSENVRSGPSLSLEVGFPLALFGSSTSSQVFTAALGYVLAGHDALGEVSATAQTRLEEGRVVDQYLRAEARGATPTVGPFRLVGRLTWAGRRNDTSNTLVSLGGDNGLRGFVSQAFFDTGANLLRGNVEVRSLPVVLQSIHIGAVLFYDVGAVYESADDVRFHHAVGLGLRVLFPQFNRYAFRGDAGMPLEGEPTVVPSFGGLQAVPLTAIEDDLAL